MLDGIKKLIGAKSVTTDPDVPRELTDEEQAILRWMLEHGPQRITAFRSQIDGMLVTKGCRCGCPTIHLHIREDVAPVGGFEETMICDMIGRTAKGELVGVMLFQSNGKLSEVEAWSVDGQISDPANQYGFPVPESLGPMFPSDSQ